MRIYIAGPMRGYELFNFPAFDAAAEKIKSLGHMAISPAAMDRVEGFDGTQNTEEYGFNVRDAMVRDILALSKCDAIALLPGWEKSRGAQCEYHAALAMELRIIYLDEGGLYEPA